MFIYEDAIQPANASVLSPSTINKSGLIFFIELAAPIIPFPTDFAIEKLSSELRVDDEVVADVIKTDFEEKEYRHAWLENAWLDGVYVQVFHTVDGIKGLKIVE